MNRLMLTIFLTTAFFTPAFAADDDKEEPKLTLPQAKAKFEKADKALNAAWAEVKKTLDDGAMAPLREDQRAWVEWREHIATSPNYSGAPSDPDEAKSSPEYWGMAADLSVDRTEWLRAFVKQTNQADEGMTGHWSDSYGGNLDIVEKNGQIFFSFDVVRGRGANVGSLSGIARWHTRIGWFSDKGRDKEKTDEANLSFVYHQPKLEVTEAGADYYHGHAATFDGSYVKVKPLTTKEEAEIIKAGKTGEAPEGK